MTTSSELVYSTSVCPVSRQQLIELMKKSLSEKRFNHILRVEEMALKLAEQTGESLEKASIAALVHDYAKERPDSEMIQLIKSGNFDQELIQYGNAIWHGILGAELIESELGITDSAIKSAVRLHTTGAKEMSLLDKIIYVADYIELGRVFPIVEEARKLAFADLDQAVAFETYHVLLYLMERNLKIYPKTVETYNQWVAKK